MSSAVHVVTATPPVPGYSLYCGKSLFCSGFIRRSADSPSLSIPFYRIPSRVKVESLRSAAKKALVCKASSSGYSRNPDFSRQNKQGFSRSRNRQNGERDSFENLEEPEPIASKNGSLVPIPDSTKFQATATPGPREKEIVELFRKVQAQLRERAAIKEEKKIEALQGKGKENETVDSLLKLLRKHSVEQGKRGLTIGDSGDLINHRSAPNSRLNGDMTSNSFKKASPARDELNPRNVATSRRPVSKFIKKSPVPQVRVHPVHTQEEEDAPEPLPIIKQESMIETHPDDLDLELEQELDHDEPESEIESLFSNMTILHEAASSDEEIDESEIEKENEPYKDEEVIEDIDYSSLKLTELRALAKVRGLKGFSKLKKGELVKLLS